MDFDPSGRDLEIVLALTRQLPNDAQRIAWSLHGSAGELWCLHLAASGEMRYPNQTGDVLPFPDGPVADRGLRRYQVWRASLVEVLRILGPREAFLRTGYDESEMRGAVERFFESLDREAPLDARAGEPLPIEIQELIAHIAEALPPEVSTTIGLQTNVATIRRYAPKMVDIDVPDAKPLIDLPDGPAPGLPMILNNARRVIGTLHLWVRAGRIVGLERDGQGTSGWPKPETVHVFERPDF